ncbi:MAG: LamG domain-containing protein [Anaerolineae bacterium]|nr:LamG domain-containing protein [Phycisphaerae bacterium]
MMRYPLRFAALSLAAAVALPSSSHAATDLLHEWKLDETSGATAVDAIGAIGGGIGGTSSWTSGKINNGFKTTGSTLGYVNAGNVPVSGSFSLSFWVKPEDASLDWRNMVSKHDGVAGTRSLFVGQSLNDGALRFSLYFDGTNAASIDTPAATVASGSWAFVTATWNEATKVQSLFVDGVLRASATHAGQSFSVSRASNLLFNTNSTNSIAGLGTGSWARFPGTVDDVALWSASLSAGQIKAMNSTSAIPGLTSFDAQSFASVVKAYDTNFASNIGNTRWTRTTGLSIGAGATQKYANGYAMQFDDAGVGVTSLSRISLSFDPQHLNLADTTNTTDNPGVIGADEPAIYLSSHEIDGLVTNSSIGSADIRPGTMNGDVFVMLWLQDMQGADDRAALRTELVGAGGSIYSLLDSSDQKWTQLASVYNGFDTLVRFDDASLVGAINWDFATHTDIVVDRLAVSAVPEPTTAMAVFAITTGAFLRRRRNSQLTTHNETPSSKFEN